MPPILQERLLLAIRQGHRFSALPTLKPDTAWTNIISVEVRANVAAQGFTPVVEEWFHKNNGDVEDKARAIPAGCYAGNWIAVGPPQPVIVPATAKYLVVAVIYAPPVSGGGHSSVIYSSSSQYGATTSADRTFKQNYSVDVTAGAGFLGSGAQAGFSFAYSRSTTDTHSIDVKNSSSASYTQPGPLMGGPISHDRDRICLLLNPTIDLAVAPSSVSWTFENNPGATFVCPYVGWLMGHEKWEVSSKKTLDDAGITEKDYAEIWQRDPLANVDINLDASTVDAKRYRYITKIDYEPPLTPGDANPVISYSLNTSSTTTGTSAAEDTYQVGLSVQGDLALFAKASLKMSDTWAWTNKSSTSSSVSLSDSATANIGGPASGYVGSNQVSVYYDTIYKTFAFSMARDQPLIAKGVLRAASQAPLPASEVSLVANGITYHTFTNAKGEFKFFGYVSGPIQLGAKSVSDKILPHAQPETSIELLRRR